jgi:hypothetical protein
MPVLTDIFEKLFLSFGKIQNGRGQALENTG